MKIGQDSGTTPKPGRQPALLPELPLPIETDLEIVRVEVGGGAVQFSWDGLEIATIVPPSWERPRVRGTKEKLTPRFNRVKVKGGGEQLAFL